MAKKAKRWSAWKTAGDFWDICKGGSRFDPSVAYVFDPGALELIENGPETAAERDALRDELGDCVDQLAVAAEMLDRSGWKADAEACRIHERSARAALALAEGGVA